MGFNLGFKGLIVCLWWLVCSCVYFCTPNK